MIGFFLKKNFCDGWDNIFCLIVPNLLITVFGGLAVLVFAFMASLETPFALVLTCAAFIVLLGLFMVLAMGFSESAAQIADFGVPTLSEYFKQIPKVFSDAFRYGTMLGGILVMGFVGIPFYTSLGKVFGFALSAALAVLEVVVLLSLQWFIAIKALLHDNFAKCLKKCFIIFFDNTAFSIFMAIYTAFLIPLTALFLTIIPGASGIVLAQVNALRLRLYKYDWLEKNPQYANARDRKKVPWKELTQHDREILGPRTFKSFVMPWKE